MPKIAVDIETTGLNVRKCKILSIAYCDEQLVGHFYDFRKDTTNISEIEHILADPFIEKIFHNAKFDISVLSQKNIPVAGNIHDTLTMIHLLNEYEPTKSLKLLAKKYINDPCQDAALYDEWTNKNGYEDVPDEILRPYNLGDCYRTMKLFYLFSKEIFAKFPEIYAQEMALLPVIMKMESRGLLADISYAKTKQAEIFYQSKELTKSIFSQLGKSLNLGSSQQLGRALFSPKPNGLGLECKMFSDKTGLPSASKDSLLMFPHIPVVRDILMYRKISKLDEFFENIKGYSEDSILFTNWNSTGTVTGRPSSSRPNLLNIPKENEDLKQFSVRKAFLCRPGYANIYFDYDQMELIAFAYLSGEEVMKQAVLDHADMHQIAANDIGLPTYRFAGKTINFAIIYGMGIPALVVELNQKAAEAKIDHIFTRDEAKHIFDTYQTKYKSIAEMFHSTKTQLKNCGYIKSFSGRYFRTPYYLAYKAVNALIQGTCADIVKIAMIAIDRYLSSELPSAHLLLQIYDELIIEVPISTSKSKIEDMKRIIEGSNPTNIPFSVSVKISKTNWAEKEKFI